MSLCSSALCYHVQPEVEQKGNRDRRAHIWNVLERHEEQREAEGGRGRRKAKHREVQSHKRNLRPTHWQLVFPGNRTWSPVLCYGI